jgi:hypothetical protein
VFGRKQKQPAQRAGSQAQRRAPNEPAELSMRSWAGVLRRTLREFKDDNLTDWSAALTYYGILSIFPATRPPDPGRPSRAPRAVPPTTRHPQARELMSHAPNHSDAPAVNGS